MKIAANVKLPAVVKPAREGSTIGMSIVKTTDELSSALELAFAHDEHVLVESFVEGVEITVGVLGIRSSSPSDARGFSRTPTFSIYENEVQPPDCPNTSSQPYSGGGSVESQEFAVKAHRAIGCRGFSRVDLIVDESGSPFVLEVNTIPGMTELSLFPDAAKAGGARLRRSCREARRTGSRGENLAGRSSIR